MEKRLKEALDSPVWKAHKVGDSYSMVNVGGKKDSGWSIAYYPLFGTYKNEVWIDFAEPRALIEKRIPGGIDLREVPIGFMIKQD